MYELLKENLQAKVNFSEEDFEKLIKYLKPKQIKKKEHFVVENNLVRHMAFVNKGILRSYMVNNAGVSVTVMFAVEGYWIGDLYSFISGKPAIANVEALESGELLLMDKQSFDKALDEIPTFERFFRLLLQNAYIASQKRISNTFSESSQEQYLEFIKNHKDFVQRIPQHLIASYLGIKPQSLSRIRKNIFNKDNLKID